MSRSPENGRIHSLSSAPVRERGRSEQLVLLGFVIWNPTWDTFWSWWVTTLQSSDRKNVIIALANATTLNICQTNSKAHVALNSCDLILNDGIGLRLGAKMRNVSVPYNFNGTDLIPRLCLETPSKLKIFLYGGTEEANMKASQTLSARYPTVEMVGRVNGYVDQDGVAPMIAASQADLLLVCLGNPLQEIYLAENRDKFGVKVALGVGGLVDFLSAVKPRAPDWMRRFGLEWVFRLGLEPKRMAKRYLVGNPLFLFRCLTALGSDKKLQDIIMNEVEAPR